MDEFVAEAFREREAREVLRKRAFLLHLVIWAAVNVFLVVVWAATGSDHPWFLYPLGGWGIGVAAHGASTYLMAHPDDVILQREQQRMASTRSSPDDPSA